MARFFAVLLERASLADPVEDVPSSIGAADAILEILMAGST
jgi:hypothetical protein